MARLDPAKSWPFPSAPEERQSDYSLVEEYFDHEGPMCPECEYYQQWTEVMGEYMGSPARQTFSDCLLLEKGGVELCPALDELIEEAQNAI